MWKDITLNNQNHILSLLNEIKEQITGIENLIREQNSNSIYDFFVKAKIIVINFLLNNTVQYLLRMIFMLIS